MEHDFAPWTLSVSSCSVESVREALTASVNTLCAERQPSRHFTEHDLAP